MARQKVRTRFKDGTLEDDVHSSPVDIVQRKRRRQGSVVLGIVVLTGLLQSAATTLNAVTGLIKSLSGLINDVVSAWRGRP